jgi:phosphate transport system ATP-binding protein
MNLRLHLSVGDDVWSETLDDPYIEVKNFSLSYSGKLAFKNISLTIERGSITSMVGPSGCGKTSFLIALNRLSEMIEGCRTIGAVRIQGKNILDFEVSALRRKMGMIFQKPNPFPLTIWKNLDFPLRECGLSKAEAAALIEESLHKVGLWKEVKDRLHTPALALSGGQQQRLCIARALCLKPEVLLMDEPCSALDPISSGTIEDLITQLRGSYTIVIVTHNLAQARRISNHTAVFWVHEGSGQLVEHGLTSQIFGKPRHEITSAYIEGARG